MGQIKNIKLHIVTDIKVFDSLHSIHRGKTKEIIELPEYECGQYVLMVSDDQITCGDGARKEILEGKGALSNATTAAVFQLLTHAGLRNHFHRFISETECIVENCEMI